ncbi:MAG TPA: YqaJ viral recombinase family protein [Methylomirabilota bacterium]|jgi:hypothetical protein|nr:YqaJ viral recombinase family protein [Methylomirabilota bacterium]
MIVLDCAQRSDAWWQARRGRLTASRAHDILARPRRGDVESAARRTYRRQLVLEQLTGLPHARAFVSRAMLRGREKEAAARAAYAARTGQSVQTSGFVAHDELLAGCSLDGHVGSFAGVVEIKAPNTLTHLRYLAQRRVPRRYLSQITHHLWITGAAWCDFVSFDDRLPARLQLLIVRVPREDIDIAAYDQAARQFLADVAAQVTPLETLRPVDFFHHAPLDLARAVLALCTTTVHTRITTTRASSTRPTTWAVPSALRA